MKRGLALAGLLAAVMFAPRSHADDRYRVTMVPGADAGTTAFASVPWLAGNQFMITCPTYSGVTYRTCPAADAGAVQCVATSNDSPLEADKSIDLCGPSGYSGLSLYKAYDAGNPSCRVFQVVPKTVCQTP